jgi:D-amino-acid dehydrogenase
MTETAAGAKHIVIVGAGIVGIGTAIWLLRDGHRVTIVDAKGPAEGTSYGNAGILANSSIVPVTSPGLLKKVPAMLFGPNGPLFLKWRYLPRLLPWLYRYLSHCTVAEVERIAAALMPIIGDSVDQHLAIARGTAAERFIQPIDYTYAYTDREAYLGDALAWRIRREHGFVANELDAEALHASEPNRGADCRYGVQLPGHAWIRDPGAYVKALCAHAQSQGAALRIATVRDFEFEDAHLRAVLTDQERIDCDTVVLATGAWSARLCAQLGLTVALESERGYHVELFDAEGGPSVPIALAAYKFIATPMLGRLRLAGLVEFGGLVAPASEAPYQLLIRQAKTAFPNLRWGEEKRWLGHRPATTDSLPVIGPVPGKSGVHLAFGHQHVGLTGGPKTGRIVADLIAGRRANFDLTPYRSTRFEERAHSAHQHRKQT